jgi:hypothetical protein
LQTPHFSGSGFAGNPTVLKIFVGIARVVKKVAPERLEVGLATVLTASKRAQTAFVDVAASPVSMLEIGQNLRESRESARRAAVADDQLLLWR